MSDPNSRPTMAAAAGRGARVVCPACGGTDLRPLGASLGPNGEVRDRRHCRACGWAGVVVAPVAVAEPDESEDLEAEGQAATASPKVPARRRVAKPKAVDQPSDATSEDPPEGIHFATESSP